MAIAYTNGPITHTTLRSDTTAHFIQDVHDVLVGCNWAPTTIPGGYQFLLQSPQGLQAKMRLTDNGDTRAKLQFFSVSETHAGYAHKIQCEDSGYNSHGYRIVANRCQIFISLHGITVEVLNAFVPRNYSMSGGIPFIPQPTGATCTASGGGRPSPDEIWWSCGIAQNTQDFRNGRYCNGAYSYFIGGELYVGADNTDNPRGEDSLRLYPLTSVDGAVEAWWAVPDQTLKYATGEAMYLHPWIGWSHSIFGQVWDAFLLSRDTPVDTIFESDGGSQVWIGWGGWPGGRGGGGTYHGTLYLLTGPPTDHPGGGGGEVGNFAY